MQPSWRWAVAGFALGGLIGMTVLTANVVTASESSVHRKALARDVAERQLLEVAHTPALLVSRGEETVLKYTAVCAPDERAPSPCLAEGTLFVRGVGDSAFTQLQLTQAGGRTMSVRVPTRYLNGRGFDYYAVIDSQRGDSVTIPAGGAAAPEHTWTVPRWTSVDLGAHAFGRTRSFDDTVVSASWGNGEHALGLDGGPQQSRIGPSAFDVGADGAVTVLDQVNRRLVTYSRVAPDAPRHVPIPFEGGEGDLALGYDGTAYVLDQGGSGSASSLVRTISSEGQLVSTAALAQRSADMIRMGPTGPVVHAYPAEEWLPTGRANPPLNRQEQLAGASSGRPVTGGRQVFVDASPSEGRFALVAADGVVNAWRITSVTDLGEVQLAEPFAGGLLVVLRLWTETQAEFVVLRLTAGGLDNQFSVDRAEWAESAALSRFRLSGDSLYQLRSAPDGLQIVTYNIGRVR
jgi:hypothetical protein